MTVQDLIDDLNRVEVLTQAGLKTVVALSPATAAPVAAVSAALPIVSSLITIALSAWSKASGQAITVESIQALLPNPVPLTAPDPKV